MIGKRDRGAPDHRARLVMLQAPESPAANAYRLVLPTILPAEPDGGPRRTLVVAVETSADGAVAAANLGVAAAAAGARTVVVDCNLRAPRLHTWLGVENERGLSSLLGTDKPAALVAATNVAGLCLLPAGSPASGGLDLLARPALGDAVRTATADADLVLVSCAALSESSDAILVASWVDSAILVIGARGTKRQDAARARDQLERAGVRILGALFFREGRVAQ